MKNTQIIKLGGALAIFSFLFLPVASCASLTINGVGLLENKEIDSSVKLWASLSMICGITLLLLKDKAHTFLSAIGGLACLFLAYIAMKAKLKDSVSLESGAYLSMLGFTISAYASKIKKELFDNNSDSELPKN